MPIPSEIDTGFKIEEEKLWAIPLATESVPLRDLENNLDIPYLESIGTDDWNLTPRMLAANMDTEVPHATKVHNASLHYPIDIYFFRNQWIILDGVHRFTKAYLLGHETIAVRRVPDHIIPQVVKTQEEYRMWQAQPDSN